MDSGDSSGNMEVIDINTLKQIYCVNISSLPNKNQTMNNKSIIFKAQNGMIMILIARNNNTIESKYFLSSFNMLVFETTSNNKSTNKLIVKPPKTFVSGLYCVNHVSVSNDASMICGCNNDGNAYILEIKSCGSVSQELVKNSCIS